jgi:adenylyltransferase/sulfurtransferase
VFAEYDLVVECTDDMRSRYLSSDAAVLAGKPVVFASVYQYEGQLHVYGGRPGEPCLRCLWPQAPDPAVVGTCVDAGVLGPVVGVLGGMQAAEALKRLLGLPGLDGSLALVDLLDLGVRRIDLPAAGECACAAQGGCAAVARRALAAAAAEADLELAFASLEDAQAAGYQLVDLREPAEIAAEPLPAQARQLPSGQVAAHAGEFAEGRFLLLCASGRRSLHAARSLRAAGAAGVYSLAGGLAALRAAAVAEH